jgi:uncharacterized membrane protein YdjX (TVP38/TMEM64 family)
VGTVSETRRLPAATPKSPWRWSLLALGAAAVAALLFFLWSAWDREDTMAQMRDAGPLPFFAATALLPAIGMPITPLFLVAGATFGVRLGLLGSGLALAVNLALCYWIARSGIRRWLTPLLHRFNYELPDLSQRDRRSVRFTLLMKLAPGVPAFVKNYALGAAGVPFPLYFGVSMLLTGTYCAALVLLGESLVERHLSHAIVAVAVLLVLALGFWWWRRRRN